ncbi:MAG: ATP-binding protein, partial [Lachnospiraceae bacterium]|nr:ATP-binding protein [Lachnospiraceae bacterium]
MSEDAAAASLNHLCDFLQRYYGKKAIILLDEYDAPMQEAYVYGQWDELVSFLRSLFNATFKSNPYLGRAILTGITRVGKESIFSDLNNLEVVTSTSNKYKEAFGFTQEEVSDALQEFGLSAQEDMVRDWYDGFTFGDRTDIYNPWSIANFLEKREFGAYWVNTSSNRLVNERIRKGDESVKFAMEDLLKGGVIHANIDEQIVFDQLDESDDAIWSLLLASGYLKVEHHRMNMETGEREYDLKLTNKEVTFMFRKMIKGWFTPNRGYNGFIKALLSGNLADMNSYMNEVALATFSHFDSGTKPSETAEPERFYHGFVLGMMVDLSDCYAITSNRESGFGRYDVMLKPLHQKEGKNPAIIMEFKVHNPKNEKTLQETAQAALAQVKEKNYASALTAEGIAQENIREYGFAFRGKEVLIVE